MTVYIIMATYSCTYAYRKLTRPGTSSEIKFVFIRKHITYVLTFSIIWVFYLCYTYFNLRFTSLRSNECAELISGAKTQGSNKDTTKDNCQLKNWLLYVSQTTAVCTGVIMTIIRTREPYFKYLIKSQWMSFFGEIMDEKEVNDSQKYVNDSLATFLTSSLNVELVHCILTSITSHSSGKVEPDKTHDKFTE